jgi:hypothetical protein
MKILMPDQLARAQYANPPAIFARVREARRSAAFQFVTILIVNARKAPTTVAIARRGDSAIGVRS